jgi:hypothetical protein
MRGSTVATITPASATEGPAVFEFSLIPFCYAVDYTLHSPMELLEVLITTTMKQ